MSSFKKIPGPRKGFGILNIIRFRKDPLRTILDATRDYGDVVCFKFGPETVYLISHPDHLKQIFVERHQNYGKQTRIWKKLSPFLGQGLLTSEGDFWKKERKLLQPAFHREKIAHFANQMVQSTEEMAQNWEKRIPKGPLDVWTEMMRLTLQILGKTLLSVDFSAQATLVRECIDTIVTHINWQGRRLIHLPSSIPTPRNLRFTNALKIFDRLVYKMITDRRNISNQPHDLLSLLLNIQDENTNERMSDRQIRDELMTFIFAGHETTANALTWSWYLISKHSEVQHKLAKELHEVLNGKPPTVENLSKLSYLECVIKEAMRLYPPVWFLGRTALQEDRLGDYRILPQATLMPSFYVTHHRPDFWNNPERFDPDRFLPEKFSVQHPYAYLPFGTGPRQCIGNIFAMMEMKLVIATLLQQYNFELLSEHPVAIEPSLTLRPRHGIKVVVSER